MKFYVAGRTTDAENISDFADTIESEGHEITFKWWGEQGEIRTDIKPEDLQIEAYTPSGLGPQTVGMESDPNNCSCKITHMTTGVFAVGTGRSRLQASDEAMRLLRAKLNAGWRDKPERARELALREIEAVNDCDVLLLIWAPDILGAAIEFGAAAMDKRLYVYRPERDSVFWYLPNVKQIKSLSEMFDDLKEN
jgi:hypothetical protein